MAGLTGMTGLHDPDQRRAPALGAGNLAHAAWIAWQRARNFNFLQPQAPNRAGALIAPWLWPVELFGVALEAPRIRRLGGASMTLTGATRDRADPVILVAAATVYLLFVVVLIVVGGAAAIALARFTGIGVALATALALLTLLAPLLTEATRRVARVLRHPENRAISRRRRELALATGRPVLIMTAFVRARPGEGAALLSALRREWDRDRVTVILNPANKKLVGYYARHGAVPDTATWRRLAIPPGHHHSAPAPQPDGGPARTQQSPI